MAKPSLKRGESGASNASTIPFRYGGSRCNLSTTIGNPNSFYGAGSRLVQAMALAVRLPNFNPSENLIRKTDNAMRRCTSPYLT